MTEIVNNEIACIDNNNDFQYQLLNKKPIILRLKNGNLYLSRKKIGFLEPSKQSDKLYSYKYGDIREGIELTTPVTINHVEKTFMVNNEK